MPRTETVRKQIQRLVRAVPFKKFVINLENGDRALVEHPENLAFDPKDKGGDALLIVAGKHFVMSTFDAVSGITVGRTGLMDN